MRKLGIIKNGILTDVTAISEDSVSSAFYFGTKDKIVDVSNMDALEGSEIRCGEITSSVVPSTFESAKQKKLRHAHHMYTLCTSSPVVYDQESFDFDERSRRRLRIAFIGLPSDTDFIFWGTTGGGPYPLMKEDVVAIMKAGTERFKETLIKYNDYVSKIKSATSLEELYEVNW